MDVSKRRIAPVLILSTALATLGGAATAAPPPGPVEVVKQATADFDKGDMKAALAGFAGDVSIIDEFPPYHWRGPDGASQWLAGFGAFTQSAGWTDTKATITSVARSDIDGDTAYVVVREVLTYKQHGRRMAEPGSQTFTLRNGADGWKVTASAWAGSHAMPVAAKPKAAATPAAAPAAKKP